MTQIVFANIIEICFLMTYVVFTMTCRNEFEDTLCFILVWMAILAYFLFYVYRGYNFVVEFQQLVQDCELFLAPLEAAKNNKSKEELPNEINPELS